MRTRGNLPVHLGSAALVVACASHAGRRPDVEASADAESDIHQDLHQDACVSPDALADAPVSCEASTRRVERIPIAIDFVIDASGSMDDLVGPEQSKWSAIVSAIAAFVVDPLSSGLGIGIEYFPVTASGAAPVCSSDEACGPQGPCFLGVCADADEAACAVDADCSSGASCVPVATCDSDPNTLCVSFGAPCGADDDGFDLGNCGNPLTTSYCANADSCAPEDYAQAAVPVAQLPAAAEAVVTSLESRRPQGGAPTAAALQGGIETAGSYVASHPGHDAVVVLVTDGALNEAADPPSNLCAPVGADQSGTLIAQVVAAGLRDEPGIETFALGVLTPADVGPGTALLDEIAASGGTSSPFVIDTASADGGVGIAQELDDALAQIRSASLPCAFALPSSDADVTDFDAVNVTYTSGAGMDSTIPYVESSAACAASANGSGWYYDADPAEGGAPAAIDVCPATCAELGNDPAATVAIVLGCPTSAP